MPSEELELRQQIAKVEEKISQQFDEKEKVDGMNDYLENIKAKFNSTPISTEVMPSHQKKIQGSIT